MTTLGRSSALAAEPATNKKNKGRYRYLIVHSSLCLWSRWITFHSPPGPSADVLLAEGNHGPSVNRRARFRSPPSGKSSACHNGSTPCLLYTSDAADERSSVD